MSKIDKLIKMALDGSIGEKESLAFFNKARKLSQSPTTSSNDKIEKYNFSCPAADLFSKISILNHKSNELGLEFDFAVSGDLKNASLDFAIKGDSSSIKTFNTYYLDLCVSTLEKEEKLKPADILSEYFSVRHGAGFSSNSAFFKKKYYYNKPKENKPKLKKSKVEKSDNKEFFWSSVIIIALAIFLFIVIPIILIFK